MNTVLFWGIAKQKLKSLVLVIKKGRWFVYNTIGPFTYFEYQISGGIFFSNLQVKLLATYFI
jgi:hypothetical protein